MEHIQLAVQQAGPVRTETLMGREYRVVPAKMVRSQVLNNNLGRTFLPEADITPAWANASNDAPVVLDHPTSRGYAVTARSPDVLNARGLGRIYNVRAENGQMTGDVFLDPSRGDVVPDLNVILAKVEAGEPVELSTGFPVSIERVAGVHNGQNYDVIIHPAGPLDHLAVFADKRGACSVKDGCGLGVNCSCHEPAAEAAPEVPPPAAQPGIEPPTEKVEMREQLIAQLTAAGEDAEALNKLSDAALQRLANQPAQNTDESEVWKRMQEYRAENERLQATYQPVLESQERERVRLLDDVLAVQARPWSDQELVAMKFEDIQKIHKALCQRPDYSGRGGPRGFSQNALTHEVRPFFGSGGVFTAKEA